MKSHGQRLLAICVMLACWSPAYAYLDPATGSILIQGLIATIAAGWITSRLYWQRFKDYIGWNKKIDSRPQDDEIDEQ